MCDPNIRDIQRGAAEEEGAQRGPEGPPCYSSTSHKPEKLIPLWPPSTSAVCVLTCKHPFSAHCSSTYGLNYCLTYRSAELLYSTQDSGFTKATFTGLYRATGLVLSVKQNGENSSPGGKQQLKQAKHEQN